MDKYTITYIKNSACNKSSKQLVLFSDFFLLSRSPFLCEKQKQKQKNPLHYILHKNLGWWKKSV